MQLCFNSCQNSVYFYHRWQILLLEMLSFEYNTFCSWNYSACKNKELCVSATANYTQLLTCSSATVNVYILEKDRRHHLMYVYYKVCQYLFWVVEKGQKVWKPWPRDSQSNPYLKLLETEKDKNLNSQKIFIMLILPASHETSRLFQWLLHFPL